MHVLVTGKCRIVKSSAALLGTHRTSRNTCNHSRPNSCSVHWRTTTLTRINTGINVIGSTDAYMHIACRKSTKWLSLANDSTTFCSSLPPYWGMRCCRKYTHRGLNELGMLCISFNMMASDFDAFVVVPIQNRDTVVKRILDEKMRRSSVENEKC